MNKKLLMCFFWVWFAANPLGLFGQELMRIANKQFELDAYELAARNYQKVLAVNPLNGEAMFNLAECYRLSKQYNEALSWYDHLMKMESFHPNAYLHYGHILKSMGKYKEAKTWYEKYTIHDRVAGTHFAESCDKAIALLESSDRYEIQVAPWNSGFSDFGVSFAGNQLVFCSFRNDIKHEEGLTNGNAADYNANQLYTFNDEQEIIHLRRFMVSSFHVGPISYAGEQSDLVAYSRNNFKNNVEFVRADDAHMSLFFADLNTDSKDFTNERPFPYNETGSSSGFPAFTDNGNTLYFASNRSGGFGGYDIYVSYFRDNKWTQPENLGPEVNSAGNEITPYFDTEKGQLYFASDFHLGIGGYDIFYAEKLGDQFGPAVNMGKGINSPMDDYFFAIAPGSGLMYFTSNRLGGSGGNDIYTATFIGQDLVEAGVPEALDLTSLEIGESDAGATLVSEVSNEAAVGYLADNHFSMADARLFSKGEVVLELPPAKVYFIQVAALSRSSGNLNIFYQLSSYGNLYKVHKDTSTKIRLGYYSDRSEAAKILSKVKSMGYNDAFIVEEPLNTSEMELVKDGNTGQQPKGSISSSFTPATNISSYKVRLASYTDPLWFDIGRVSDLGDIEQWTKGKYTIFILSGYGSLENAQTAMVKARNRGFTDAHIVVDNNGYLEKLKEN